MNPSDTLIASAVYAKVENGNIVEYPVYGQHIINRGHPFEWYTRVQFDAQPVIPQFHYAREIPAIVDGVVRVSYAVEPLDLSSLLRHINPQDLIMPGNTQSVNIADIDPAVIERIKQLATLHVQKRLDEFAQEKGYDSLLSATSYKDSSVIQFSTEATIAIQLRDQVWNSLYSYFDQVLAGTQPVPASIADIESNLPAFSWV